jgi:peptidoglycan-associated lipoprotein
MKIVRNLLSAGLIVGLTLGAAGIACQKKGPAASSDVDITDIPLEMIHFDFDKYNIKPTYQKTLENHAQWLKDNGNVNIVIEGNTDEWGTDEYNMALGERRAVAAKNYLTNLGISPDRIATISYGEARPLDSAHNDSAWAKNRRDEFKGRK